MRKKAQPRTPPTSSEQLLEQTTAEVADIFARFEVDRHIEPRQFANALISYDDPKTFTSKLLPLIEEQSGTHALELHNALLGEIMAIYNRLPRVSLGNLSSLELYENLQALSVEPTAAPGETPTSELVADMRAFLGYCRDSPPRLTAKLGRLPEKELAAFNSLRQHPTPLEQKVGDYTFRQRHEDEVWQIDLIRQIAEVTHAVYRRKGSLRLAKRGRGWLDLDVESQCLGLFLAWCSEVNWDYITRLSANESFQDHYALVFNTLLALQRRDSQLNLDCIDDICMPLAHPHVSAPVDERRYLRGESYYLLLRQLEYWSIVEPKPGLQPRSSWQSYANTYIITPLGRWLLGEALLRG